MERPRAIKLKRIVKMIIAKVHRKVYVKLKMKANHRLQSNMGLHKVINISFLNQKQKLFLLTDRKFRFKEGQREEKKTNKSKPFLGNLD